ncbi:MAG: apolipoprotein N-acyltransferase [Armatimonadia bacterium]|nr:apolipoprotein N-acyltransferase [Armatimonadia bacterium]
MSDQPTENAQPTPDTSTVPPVDRVQSITWLKLLLAVISGALLFTAFPPVDLGPVAWFALIPLFFALTQVRAWGGFVIGTVFGFTFIGLYASFMLDYGFMAWFGSVGFQSLFFGVFGLAAAMCNSSAHPGVRALATAGAWTLVEMFRGGIGGLGFTVGNLGYTQYDRLPLLQAASMIGHFGIGFFMALVNAAMAQVVLAIAPGLFVRARIDPGRFATLSAKAALGAYVIALLVFIWGALVMRFTEETGGEPMEVAAVQASLSDIEGTSVERADERIGTYLALSRTIPDAVQVIVWPETAVPAALNTEQSYADQIAELAVDKSAWVIAGGYKFEQGNVYNTLFTFSPEGEMTETYSKVILVPFGESVPWSDRFPWLRKFALRKVDFSPGAEHKLLDLGDVDAGPLICFEALFPHAVRTNTRLGADVIVIGTSDAWAEGSFEIEQHSVTAPLRAVEARRYVIRAASWGRSQIIAPDGEILASVPIGEAGAAWAEIRPRDELSTYHRWGDLPLQILCGVLLWFGLLGLPRRTNRDEEAAPDAGSERVS